MSLRNFFRPTPWTVSVTLVLTALATIALYATLLCALNGQYSCPVPVAAQLILVIIMWPWAAAIRLLGTANIGIASILGIVISGLWLFGWVCVGRGITSSIRKKRHAAL
jgi:hypothetical protein